MNILQQIIHRGQLVYQKMCTVKTLELTFFSLCMFIVLYFLCIFYLCLYLYFYLNGEFTNVPLYLEHNSHVSW